MESSKRMLSNVLFNVLYDCKLRNLFFRRFSFCLTRKPGVVLEFPHL